MLKMNWGPIAMAGIFVISAIAAALKINGTALQVSWLMVAILGVYIALKNIQIKEEIGFLVGVTAFVLIVSQIGPLGGELLYAFLINTAIGFGAAGLLIALGLIIRLGYKY